MKESKKKSQSLSYIFKGKLGFDLRDYFEWKKNIVKSGNMAQSIEHDHVNTEIFSLFPQIRW